MFLRNPPSPSRAFKYRWLLLLTIPFALIAGLPSSQRAQRQDQTPNRQPLRGSRERTKGDYPQAVPGEIIVRFRPESKSKGLGPQLLIEKTGRQIALSIQAISPALEIVEGLRLARVNPADTSDAIEALRARPDVLYAEPNFIRRALATPNDPRYAELWGLKNTGQASTPGGNPGIAGNDIRAEQAWDVTKGSRSVVVGIIDSGIDINHEDLRDNIWTNPAEVPGNNFDDDGNGFVDDINGWDFAHNDATVFDYAEATFPPSPTYAGDEDSHGTHVAGTIGAIGDNGKGVVGVNWQVSLMSLKALSETAIEGTSAHILNAYSYAKAMRQLWQSSGGTKGANIRVLNNSYGGFGFSQAELDAIRALGDAGILFVVAAGNDSISNDQYPTYPTNYIATNLISVAASNGSGRQAGFSSFGEGTVNVTAPGDHILSTTPKNTYSFFDGTSMSAPHVTGTAALVCAQFPNITVQKLRSVVMYSGYLAPWQFFNGFPISTGRAVDARKALDTVNSPDVTAPGAISNLSAEILDAFPNYRLIWNPPGDDGNSGKVAAFEIRFSDTALNDANFELAKPLGGPMPNDPGVAHFHNVKVPWRHASGFIGIRAVDEAGNKGPISSVPVSVNVDVGDPYTMTETAVSPLSTGGIALELKDDDAYRAVSLPFTFRFYGIEYNQVTLSTNGTLYFGFPPFSHDAFRSQQWLNGNRMIAGLWDDLRTDRTGGDVFVVQDADRIIFRWQAVTFDSFIAPGVRRGENPVNFEIELRFDGRITIRYGEGNQKLFPVVGIGGGWPEPYVSTSHTSEFNLKNLTNAGTVVFTRRNPVQRPVLTVASSNPASGVNITVSPSTPSGAGNGTTQFTRAYNLGTTVTLTAPETVNGNKFQRWQRDGVDWSGQVTTSVSMTGLPITMTAIYVTPPVLTVTSSNPNSGVNITVIPNDRNGSGNGTTPFTRTYELFTSVNLTAPLTVGTSTFWKWQVNGVDYVQHQLASVNMNEALTAKAIYVTATPTPTPTPVPGAGTQTIAFVKLSSSPSGGADIFLSNADGTNVVNITDAAGDDTRPAWSPDGSRFAYTCLRQPDGSVNPPQRICVRNANGTGLTVLSNTLAEDFGPSWSRDGTQIAFTTFVPGFQSVIGIMNADGTGRIPFQSQLGSNPDWSPTGSSLVYNDFNVIVVFDRFQNRTMNVSFSAGDSRPRFSPNGSKIVFQSSRDGQAEIYVMNSDGTAQTRLTNNPAGDSAPSWSPDGTKILFTSLRDNPMQSSLYVMNADGSNQTRVTTGSDGVWRVIPPPPTIFKEEGTSNAAAINSVTYLRGPFSIVDPHNFSVDGHARITLLTSNLGLTSPPVPPLSTLSVQANGINLPVEKVGFTGVFGMQTSYIIVRLPNGLPTGNLSLTITLHGLTSAPTTLPIGP